jgi:plastocyanin
MDFSINIYNSYRILLIINFIFAFFLINGHIDFKINAIDIISSQTTKNNFIYGIVNSSIPKDKFDSWIATGNWSMYLKNNSPIFSLNMTWHSDGSTRYYKIFNFKPNYSNTTQSSPYVLSINGVIDISTNHQKLTSIPITLDINNRKKMILYFDDDIINRHFAKQPINGYITSSISENNLKEIQQNMTQNLFIPQLPLDVSRKNTFNNTIASYENNSYFNDQGTSDRNTSNDTIASVENNSYFNDQGTSDRNTSTIDSKTIIILENAGFSGNPSFNPDITNITKGDNLLAINEDGTAHTITNVDSYSSNNPSIGKYFDTGIIHPHETVLIDTTNLKPGKYLFVCSLHPNMKGIINVR